ncbi:hypothetical protein DB30_08003 [Enhygromyxa salina]|uniref:Helix-turn-helix domain-containing protein n=1 Tax=Enhygromyxa salina TaxID=215803 RepID=A0A0C2CQN5_9BACT|nr:helix-turn-helix domain-containing protein [Enhygromyxa salina]KIG13491.1 hypothetical protein DB30_08003 [Enhygromyxa salina]
MATPLDVEVLTVDEVAALLGVNRKSVYCAAHPTQVPHQRIGRRLIVERNCVILAPSTPCHLNRTS